MRDEIAAILDRLNCPRWLRPVVDRLDRPRELGDLILGAYRLGQEDARAERPGQRRLYFLPAGGQEMVDQLCREILTAQHRVVVVSFLPPDRRIGGALESTRRSLGSGAVQVILDATTQESVGKASLDWADRLVLPERGTIHAKAVVVDDVLWWGSWNLSRAASQQVDLVERVEDPEVVRQALLWVEAIRVLAAPADLTERPRGPFQGSQEQAEIRGPRDPDLGF